MTPEQAIEILDKATSLLQMSRSQHGQIIEAIQAIKKALEQKPS